MYKIFKLNFKNISELNIEIIYMVKCPDSQDSEIVSENNFKFHLF